MNFFRYQGRPWGKFKFLGRSKCLLIAVASVHTAKDFRTSQDFKQNKSLKDFFNVNLLKKWSPQENPKLYESCRERYRGLQEKEAGIGDNIIDRAAYVGPTIDISRVKNIECELEDWRLTPEEQEIADKFSKQLEYDDKVLLLAHLQIKGNRQNPTLYLKFCITKYSALRCLVLGKFPDNSPIYDMNIAQTGVVNVLVVRDKNKKWYTYLFIRAREIKKFGVKVLSTFAGFIDAKDFELARDNVLYQAARRELEEEADLKAEKISLGSITFQYYERGKNIKHIPVVNFFLVHLFKDNLKEFENKLKYNNGKDAKEHEGFLNEDGSWNTYFKQVPLDSSLLNDKNKRYAAFDKIFEGNKYAGLFLVNPIIDTGHKFCYRYQHHALEFDSQENTPEPDSNFSNFLP